MAVRLLHGDTMLIILIYCCGRFSICLESFVFFFHSLSLSVFLYFQPRNISCQRERAPSAITRTNVLTLHHDRIYRYTYNVHSLCFKIGWIFYITGMFRTWNIFCQHVENNKQHCGCQQQMSLKFWRAVDVCETLRCVLNKLDRRQIAASA